MEISKNELMMQVKSLKSVSEFFSLSKIKSLQHV